MRGEERREKKEANEKPESSMPEKQSRRSERRGEERKKREASEKPESSVPEKRSRRSERREVREAVK